MWIIFIKNSAGNMEKALRNIEKNEKMNFNAAVLFLSS